MIGSLTAIFVIAWIFYLIIKGYKPQTVILFGGMIMLACAIFLKIPLLDAKNSTGFVWFDMFKVIENTMGTDAAGLGLMIMSVAGFVRYMNSIGANQAMVSVSVKPLRLVSSPYILLIIAFLIGVIMKVAIVSASGLGMLLMATMYPILISLGVSQGAAVSVIVTATFIDIGPASATSQFVAKTAGIDPVTYVGHYQILIAIPVIILVAAVHYFTHKWFDKKEGHIATRASVATAESEDGKAPTFYALLPIIPLVLIFIFSKLTGSKIKMSITSAMLIGIFISMVIEFIRYRDYKKVAKSLQPFFDGMGSSFAQVVSLIIAASVFIAGFNKLVSIASLVTYLQSVGVGSSFMIVIMQVVVGLFAMLGSDLAALLSFGAMVPQLAQHLNINPVHMLLPMQLTGSMVRAATPISEVMIAVSGLAAMSPVQIVKRTAIPMAAALVLTTVLNLIIF